MMARELSALKSGFLELAENQLTGMHFDLCHIGWCDNVGSNSNVAVGTNY